MYNLPGNVYLNKVRNELAADDNTLNLFIFGGSSVKREVLITKIISDTFNMLSIMDMPFYNRGQSYLIKLVQFYLTKENYTVESALERVAAIYGVDKETVVSNVVDLVAGSQSFGEKCGHVLHMTFTPQDLTDIKKIVEIIGAVSYVYFNHELIGRDEVPADSMYPIDLRESF